MTGSVARGTERLLAALRGGEHDTLVVWHNDRLHRRPIELEEFIAVAEKIDLAVLTTVAYRCSSAATDPFCAC